MKKILVTVVSASLLNGCTTMTLIGQTNKYDVPTYHEMDDDVIRQVATPVQNGKKLDNLVLLGDKYTYKITSGDKQTKYINKLNPEFLKIDDPIIVNVRDKTSFKSTIDFTYKNKAGIYTEQEQEMLQHFSCKKIPIINFTNKMYYSCQFDVLGEIYAPNRELVSKYQLNTGRKIKLRSVNYENKKDYGELLGLPLALAIDAVTLPFQLIWTGAALATTHSK